MQETAQGFYAFHAARLLGIKQAQLHFEPVGNQVDHVELLGVDSAPGDIQPIVDPAQGHHRSHLSRAWHARVCIYIYIFFSMCV